MLYTKFDKFICSVNESSGKLSKDQQFTQIEDFLLPILDRSRVVNGIKNYYIRKESSYILLSCYFAYNSSYDSIEGLDNHINLLKDEYEVVSDIRSACNRISSLGYKWKLSYDSKGSLFVKVFYKGVEVGLGDPFLYNPEDSNDVYDKDLLGNILLNRYGLLFNPDSSWDKLLNYGKVEFMLYINVVGDAAVIGRRVNSLVRDLMYYTHDGKRLFYNVDSEFYRNNYEENSDRYKVSFIFHDILSSDLANESVISSNMFYDEVDYDKWSEYVLCSEFNSIGGKVKELEESFSFLLKTDKDYVDGNTVTFYTLRFDGDVRYLYSLEISRLVDDYYTMILNVDIDGEMGDSRYFYCDEMGGLKYCIGKVLPKGCIKPSM